MPHHWSLHTPTTWHYQAWVMGWIEASTTLTHHLVLTVSPFPFPSQESRFGHPSLIGPVKTQSNSMGNKDPVSGAPLRQTGSTQVPWAWKTLTRCAWDPHVPSPPLSVNSNRLLHTR